MRIIIELEGITPNVQTTVSPSSTSPEVPGVSQQASQQTSVENATNAGQAPARIGEGLTADVNLNSPATAPMIAQPGDHSAGAAPDISRG
jgi:hypothetical protein